MDNRQRIIDDELHDECGVFGVFGVPDAAGLTYYGLHARSTADRRVAVSSP